MSDDAFPPVHDAFGDALARAGRGEITADELFEVMLAETFVVPSESDVDRGAGFSPLLVSAGEGVQYLAAFTTPTLAAEVGDAAPFSAWLTGAALVRSISDGIGLSIDPVTGGLQLEPETVTKLRESLPPAE